MNLLRGIQVPLTSVLLILFSLSRNFAGVRYFSMASLLSLVFVVIILLVEMPFYVKYYWAKHPALEVRYFIPSL